MLGRVHFGRKRVQRITRLNAHNGLIEDVTAIHVERDPVNGAAGHLNSAAKGLTDAVESGKAREETRVKINDLAGKRTEEARLQHAHEAGKYDQIRLRGLHRRNKASLPFALQFRLERCRINKL